MSNKELDNLFRNKLGDLEKTPATSLWDRIDEKIEQPKKRSPWLFLSIAASLLLLISFSYLFLKNGNVEPSSEQVIASNNLDPTNSAETKTSSEKAVEKSTIADAQAMENKEAEMAVETKEEQKDKKGNKPKTSIQLPSNTELTTSNNTKSAKQKIEILENKEELPALKINEIEGNTAVIAQNTTPDATTKAEAASEVKNSKNGQTLVFDISQFEDSKTAVATAETDKKESKLLQIFNKAKEIKQGESGLGDIRAAKNNLLAFGGKKEGK